MAQRKGRKSKNSTKELRVWHIKKVYPLDTIGLYLGFSPVFAGWECQKLLNWLNRKGEGSTPWYFFYIFSGKKNLMESNNSPESLLFPHSAYLSSFWSVEQHKKIHHGNHLFPSLYFSSSRNFYSDKAKPSGYSFCLEILHFHLAFAFSSHFQRNYKLCLSNGRDSFQNKIL